MQLFSCLKRHYPEKCKILLLVRTKFETEVEIADIFMNAFIEMLVLLVVFK